MNLLSVFTDWVLARFGWISLVVGLGLTFTGAGYLAGHAWSPNYSDPTHGPAMIQPFVSHRSARVVPRLFSKEFDRQGRLTKLKMEAQTYRFACGIETVVYDGTIDRIRREATIEDTAEHRLSRHGLQFSEAVTILAGGMSSIAVSGRLQSLGEYLAKLSSAERGMAVVKAAMAAGTGFALGFWWGFDSTPACGDPVFQKILGDPVFWQGIAKRDRDSRSWEFRWAPGFALPFAYSGGRRVVPQVICSEEELRERQRPSSGACSGWPT